jgi:hypothetical protein
MADNQRDTERSVEESSPQRTESESAQPWNLRQAVHNGRLAVTRFMPDIISGSGEKSLGAVACNVDSAVSAHIHCKCCVIILDLILAAADWSQLTCDSGVTRGHGWYCSKAGYRSCKEFTSRGHPAFVLGLAGLLTAIPSARCTFELRSCDTSGLA